MAEMDDFWGPEYPAIAADPPPPSAERVREWETRHGVRLPATLAAALALQDGGCVRGTDLVLYPLAEIEPIGGRSFRFGADDATQAQLILEYRSAGEPRVVEREHESGELAPVEGAGSFDDLLRVMRRRSGSA